MRFEHLPAWERMNRILFKELRAASSLGRNAEIDGCALNDVNFSEVRGTVRLSG